jgi:hypothetical protein
MHALANIRYRKNLIEKEFLYTLASSIFRKRASY